MGAIDTAKDLCDSGALDDSTIDTWDTSEAVGKLGGEYVLADGDKDGTEQGLAVVRKWKCQQQDSNEMGVKSIIGRLQVDSSKGGGGQALPEEHKRSPNGDVLFLQDRLCCHVWGLRCKT